MPNISLNMEPLIRIVRSAEARRFSTYPRHLSRKRPERAEIYLLKIHPLWWDEQPGRQGPLVFGAMHCGLRNSCPSEPVRVTSDKSALPSLKPVRSNPSRFSAWIIRLYVKSRHAPFQAGVCAQIRSSRRDACLCEAMHQGHGFPDMSKHQLPDASRASASGGHAEAQNSNQVPEFLFVFKPDDQLSIAGA